ncbi:MAG: hypothetical protein JWN95_1658 [Frankiales bacterium]|nr:hypothetical protein [Frankiales bacterium]
MMNELNSGEDAVEVLRRWESTGAVWRVLARTARSATVSLCRCDGGEEQQRLTSADPALLAFLADRTSSEEPARSGPRPVGE